MTHLPFDTKKPDGFSGRRVFFGSLVALLATATLGLGAPVAYAQDDANTSSPEQTRSGGADLQLVDETEVRVPRPRGWKVVEPIDEGAALVFRASRDRLAQIEVRISDEISSLRWERFLRAFDQELLESGFQASQSNVGRSFGDQPGSLYEYTVEVEGDSFLLLTWHVHHRELAWTFTAFFRESRRDTYVETFEQTLENIDWGD